MSEEEINQIYTDLMTFLRENDFTALANDIAIQIEEGYVKKEKVKVDLTLLEKNNLEETGNKTSIRQLYRRAEYSPLETLNILLNALETTIINPIRIRSRVANFFAQQAEGNASIQTLEITLYPSVDESVEPVTINSNEIQLQLQQVEGLIEAIRTVREALGNDDS